MNTLRNMEKTFLDVLGRKNVAKWSLSKCSRSLRFLHFVFFMTVKNFHLVVDFSVHNPPSLQMSQKTMANLVEVNLSKNISRKKISRYKRDKIEVETIKTEQTKILQKKLTFYRKYL